MKRSRVVLLIIGCLIIRTTIAQITVETPSWERLSQVFESIDQIGIIPEAKLIADYENIEWRHIVSEDHLDCDFIMEYSPEKKQTDNSKFVLSVKHAQPDNFELVNIAGISCIKLELNGDYITLRESAQMTSRKTNMVFFRACYQQSTFEELKSAIISFKLNCL